MASVSLRRTQSSGNRQKWTYSAWIKRTGIGVLGSLIGSSSAGNNNGYGQIRFQADDTLNFTGWSEWWITNRKFRDPNAWYHIVFAVDTTQATDTNRFKLYINGTQETSFSTINYPDEDFDLSLNVNSAYVYLGAESYSSGTSRFFDGSMSHIHFIDGTAYDASAFGETDATTGEWKIKTSPSVTYGTNGFFILKDGNSVTDQSGQGNNFTVHAGTLTKTEDCPSNVFCTWNPLNTGSGSTFSKGNLATNTGDNKNDIGTIGFDKGKYYWEVKCAGSGIVGVQHESLDHLTGTNLNGTAGSVALSSYHGTIFHNTNSDTTPSTDTDGCIIGCAVDMDNNKIYWHKDGTYYATSGGTQNPTTEANPITVATGTHTSGFWFPKITSGTGSQTFETNFGNGYFGTTAVSSAGTNASGIGIFEYDVPTGYTALSTKGLNE